MVRMARLALAMLLVGAAPAEVASGVFRKWAASDRMPLDFTSDGIRIHVAALPCPPDEHTDTTCSWEGYNNRAAVTVTAPGMVPVTIKTGRAGAYARLAVVRFDMRDPRPGVIVESQSGGSGGDLTVQLLVPQGRSFRTLAFGEERVDHVQGEISDYPRDLSGDGHIDLVLTDGNFDSVFGCNACTPRPPRIFTVRNGKVVDESRDAALRPVFLAHMALLAPLCRTDESDRNGACAAYVADAARAGRFATAWKMMLRHYERGKDVAQVCSVPTSAKTHYRCPEGHETHYRDFPDSLRAFLTRAGYLPLSSPARSRQAH